MNNNLFIAQQGIIQDKNNIKNIKNYVFNQFNNELKKRETFHKYIESMPVIFQDMVYKVKHSNEIINKICDQFKKINVILNF